MLQLPFGKGRTRQHCPRAGAKGTLWKGWRPFPTQKDTHCKHVTTSLTLLDNSTARQHTIPVGQDTQQPSDGGEGSAVQECRELALLGFETLMLIPRSLSAGLYDFQGISSDTGAREGCHRHACHDGSTGRVVSERSGVSRGRHTAQERCAYRPLRGEDRSDQHFREENLKKIK